MKRVLLLAVLCLGAVSCASLQVRVPQTSEAAAYEKECKLALFECPAHNDRWGSDKLDCPTLLNNCRLNIAGACEERQGGQCYDKAKMVQLRRNQAAKMEDPSMLMLQFGLDGGVPVF